MLDILVSYFQQSGFSFFRVSFSQFLNNGWRYVDSDIFLLQMI